MPTLAEIVTRASLFTGLVDSGGEQDLMLAFANEQYRDAQSMSECHRTTVSPNMSAYDPVVNTYLFALDIVRIINVSSSNYDGYDKIVLSHVSERKMSELQKSGEESGIPAYYSIQLMDTSDVAIQVYPAPERGFTLDVYLVGVTRDDLTDVETPSAVPARYHHSVIGNGVIAMCLDREGRHDRADVYWGRRDRSLIELTDYANRVGGDRVDSFFEDDTQHRGPNDRDFR